MLGNTTGKHWRTLASTADQWAGEIVLQSSPAKAGCWPERQTALSGRWLLAWQHKWLLPFKEAPLAAFAQNQTGIMNCCMTGNLGPCPAGAVLVPSVPSLVQALVLGNTRFNWRTSIEDTICLVLP